MFFLHNIQKKQCLFFRGPSGPVAKTFAKGASANISSVSTYPPISSPHFGRGFGRPFLDHRNGLFAFFTNSVFFFLQSLWAISITFIMFNRHTRQRLVSLTTRTWILSTHCQLLTLRRLCYGRQRIHRT